MLYTDGKLVFSNQRMDGKLKQILMHCERDAKGKVIIPNGVNRIEAGAFEGCKDVTSIQIPESVTEIGDRAFAESGITSLSLPQLEWIPFRLCAECKSLKTVDIKAGLIGIRCKAFEQCEVLQSLGVSRDIKGLVLPSGFEVIDDSAFRLCLKLETANLPSSVTNINYAAFSQSGLKMIYYPKEAIVGYHAFKGCQGLSKVIYESVSGSVMRP